MNQPTQPTGLLLVISGPSGVGKTTITHHVERELHGLFSVSLTTRPITPKDTEGVDYFFVDQARFEQARAAGELLESAQVFGNLYGTPRKPVEQAIRDGRLMILEIDVEGAIQIKQSMPNAFSVFVLPPSEEVLLQRLRSRAREDESIIQRRFQKARAEIAHAKECGVYDVFIVNDNLEVAVNEAVRVVREEMQRRQRV
jgi:guanylate kinase